MDLRERFVDAWKRRYPDCESPKLSCLESPTSYREPDVDLHEKLTRESDESLARIQTLRDELEKEEFVYHFLHSALLQGCDRSSGASQLGGTPGSDNGLRPVPRPRTNSASGRTSLSTSALPQPSNFVRVGSESETRGRVLRNCSDKFRAPNRILSFRLSRSPDVSETNQQQNSGSGNHTHKVSARFTDSQNNNNNKSHIDYSHDLRHDIVSTDKSSICYVKPTLPRAGANESISYVDKCIVAESGTALTVSIEGGAGINEGKTHNFIMERRNNKNGAPPTCVVDKVSISVQPNSNSNPPLWDVTDSGTPDREDSTRKQGSGMKNTTSVKSKPVPKPKPSVRGPDVRSRGASSSSLKTSSPGMGSNIETEHDKSDSVSRGLNAEKLSSVSNVTKNVSQQQATVSSVQQDPRVVIIDENTELQTSLPNSAQRQKEVPNLTNTSPHLSVKQLSVGNYRKKQNTEFDNANREKGISSPQTTDVGGDRSESDIMNTSGQNDRYVNINFADIQQKFGITEKWEDVMSPNNEKSTKTKTEENDGTSVDSGIDNCSSNPVGEADNVEEEISPYCTSFAIGGINRMLSQPETCEIAVQNSTTDVSKSSPAGRRAVLSTFGKSPSTESEFNKDALYSNSMIPERKKIISAGRRQHNYEEVDMTSFVENKKKDSESTSNSPVTSPKEHIYATPSPVMKRHPDRPLSPYVNSGKKQVSPLVKQQSCESLQDSDGSENFDKPVLRKPKHLPNESSSSDEEEPIYYNLLLLKKETMKKHETLRRTVFDDQVIYKNIDLQKKVRDKQFGTTNTISEKPKTKSPESLSPYYKFNTSPGASDSSLLEGDTDSSSRDSVFLRSESSPQSPEKSGKQFESANAEWRKRQSMMLAMHGRESETSLESFDLPSMNMGVSSSSVESQDKPQIRKCVVLGILDSEHMYVDCLDVLLQYMRSLQASAKSSQPVICSEDVTTIFFKIPALYDLHMDFVRKLEPIVEKWNTANDDQSVGVIFKEMAVQLPIAGEYIANYPKATATVKKCSQSSVKFQELTMAIKTKGVNETLSLEELLHKPLVRVQRNSLVLHDLIKCTPTAHEDYDLLQRALKVTQYFLENLALPQYEGIDKEFQRYLVKNSLIVELSGSKRRLRHVFLYNDLLVCAKQRVTRQKFHYDVKWFLPVDTLKLDPASEQLDGKLCNNEDVETLRKRLKTTAETLRKEVSRRKKMEDQNKDKNWIFRNNSKTIEKTKKKLEELQGQLVLASPNLKFCLRDITDRVFTFLMSSDYERNEWRDTIKVLQAKRPMIPTMTDDEVTAQINTCKQLPKVNNLGSLIRDDSGLDDETLNGVLSVTMHRLHGLGSSCDIFCCIEVDSYGHFFMKAKTNVICGTVEPVWNEGFEIDLEGSQTLRLMCYKREYNEDVILGKCALELNRAWLRGEFTEKIITLNEEMSLTVSLRYLSREITLRRMPSNVKTGVFGVPITHLTKREGTRIPLIVSTCVDEIENRGKTEVGIYRLSGLNSEIQRLKKAFNKSSKGAVHLLHDVDINVATGLLKLYFRELPEALFTDRLYHSFVDGMELADPEAKQNCMLSLFKSLPETNHSTAVFMLSHLVTISKMSDTNKMTLNNLSTVFGPTLLRPATKNDTALTGSDFFIGAQDAMMQSTILLYFLNLYSKGCSFDVITSAF